MRRFTLTTAISALLVSGMMLTSGDAVAQRRGGDRGDRRSTAVSERSSQRAATTISRGDDSRRERSTATRSGGDRVSRDNKRSEVSNWPKVNRGSSGINDAGSRERRNSQSRGDAMRRSFDERRSAGNSGGDNMGNRPDHNNRPGGNISNRPVCPSFRNGNDVEFLIDRKLQRQAKQGNCGAKHIDLCPSCPDVQPHERVRRAHK